MAQISRWVWSDCATLVVGCTLYSNYERTAVYASKQITITTGGIKRVYSTMSSGAIVSISDCTWTSSSAYNIYQPIYSGSKNNCGNGGTGSTITVNDGGAYSFAGTTTPITSYISQADADSQAQTASQNNFYAGIQNYINTYSTCTWSYYNGSATYPATYYTRNNCGAGCDAGSVQYQAVTKSGYAATSTVAYQNGIDGAVDIANGYAYSAAQAESQTLGQAYANTYGSCCCWVSDANCNGCDYRGDRQRNTCSGAYRNEYVTEYSSCSCNVSCKGTNYNNNYCGGADNKDRIYYEIYNCNGSSTGASYSVNCDCDLKQPSLTATTYTTCVGCQNITVYRDTGNRCSTTYLQYYVNGVAVGGLPSTALCNTTPDYGNDLGIKCLYGTNYYVLGNYNSCGNYRYKYYAGNEVNYTNSLDNFTNACTFSAYRSGTFTRNNCGSGYIGGSVSYSNTYYYSGINGQSGADALADANFNNDGQNYANSNGSCTAIPSCYNYNIVAYTAGVTVSGTYTTCAGSGSSFSFYAYSSGVVGVVSCAQQGSVSVTSGNGTKTTGSQC